MRIDWEQGCGRFYSRRPDACAGFYPVARLAPTLNHFKFRVDCRKRFQTGPQHFTMDRIPEHVHDEAISRIEGRNGYTLMYMINAYANVATERLTARSVSREVPWS